MERLWWGRSEDAIVRGLVFVVGDAVVAFPFQPLRLSNFPDVSEELETKGRVAMMVVDLKDFREVVVVFDEWNEIVLR